MRLTQKHFEFIARVIATYPGLPVVSSEMALHFATALTETNPKFKRELFLGTYADHRLGCGNRTASVENTNGDGEDDQQYRDWNEEPEYMSDEDMEAAHDALDKAFPSSGTIYDGKSIGGGTFERGE